MHVAFRVDGSQNIGTGHIMRCLSLAHYIMVNGGRCSFITRPANGDLIKKISSQNISILKLPSAERFEFDTKSDCTYANWLGTSQQQDALDTIRLLNEDYPDWVVVDHYSLDVEWEGLLRPYCRFIMVLDDLVYSKHDCDVLLNQNLNASVEQYQSLVPENCKVLTGPEFALLRPEFYEENRSKGLPTDVKLKANIMITMGGVDAQNSSCDVLKIIAKREHHENIKVHLVIGPSSPWKDDLQHLARELPYDINVHVNPQHMASIMAKSDLAIIASGSTTWECCAMGMPMIAIPIVDNQVHVAESLEKYDAALVAYPYELEYKLNELIETLLNNSARREELSQNALTLSDGKGGIKIANTLQEMVGKYHAH